MPSHRSAGCSAAASDAFDGPVPVEPQQVASGKKKSTSSKYPRLEKRTRFDFAGSSKGVGSQELYSPRWERPLDLCQVICDGKSSTGCWVDSNQFRVLISITILLNALFIGVSVLDLDRQWKPWEPAFAAYFSIDLTFLFIFTMELMLRVKARGKSFFSDPWSYFDATLVVANMFETIRFVLSVSLFANLGMVAAILRLSRVVRFIRVLQLLRLFRFVGDINILLRSLCSAMRTLLCSIGILVLVVYVCGLLSTRYIGHVSDDEETKMYFGDLGRSMLTLLSFATLEDWAQVARHLIDSEPGGAFLAILVAMFVLFTNLAVGGQVEV